MEDYPLLNTAEPNPNIENASVQNAITNSAAASAQAQQLQYQVEEQEKGLAEAQLECEKTLSKAFHLLK